MKREAGQGRQSGVSSQFRERAKGLLTTHVKTREPDVEVIAAESDALVGQTREECDPESAIKCTETLLPHGQ